MCYLINIQIKFIDNLILSMLLKSLYVCKAIFSISTILYLCEYTIFIIFICIIL